ncbi:hypothetical protein HYFRA_00012780 [Hymenoscyphus fraxineus]|uniref:tRNA-intron lyase n=1 Tax=Hymenoscyphus fraxineus TaxID=746836 RepID=A0A9N9PYD0_9HELO|nr:hypothetical protein HYFRA_00012780 [Hymenoscyphus fraxineus]
MADAIAMPTPIEKVNGTAIDPAIEIPKTENAAPTATAPRPPRGPTKFQMLNKRYALPAPLRTFPLPTFVPHNPLSLLHILYVWVSQTLSPQSSAFDPLYQGWFSAETRSVHVIDPRSAKALWDQGFYGKGNLSRSEPNWLKAEKEKQARGSSKAKTSEELTRKRRRERQQVKWERARLQKEAIDQKLLEEAEAANRPDVAINGIPLHVEISSVVSAVDTPPELSTSDDASDVTTPRGFVSPVGPLELLQLPNSEAELVSFFNGTKPFVTDINLSSEQSPELDGIIRHLAPVGPLELLALPNSATLLVACNVEAPAMPLESSIANPAAHGILRNVITRDLDTAGNGSIHHNGLFLDGYTKANDTVSTSVTSDEVSMASSNTEDTAIEGLKISSTPSLKRQKSVRFSPTVEQNTFMQNQPPSPGLINEVILPAAAVEVKSLAIKDQEHTQLTLEEAFFLSYALGAISIYDPETRNPITNQNLLSLFRRTSYFPPLLEDTLLAPDDPFILNYSVYHHFRSLGWVVRSGVKFSVDFMLYTRGPPFSHAEFAVLVLPSYSDSYWDNNEAAKANEKRTWAWLSCINRVITQVKKTVILCYVDIPRPTTPEEEEQLGIHGVLARYKVREFVLKRWVSNRQRSA